MTDEISIRSKHVHHVAYATRDPEATYEFYANKLGMKLLRTENHRQGDGYFRHFFFDMGGGECLAFFVVSNVGEEPGFRTAIAVGNGLPVWVNHLAFALDTLEELARQVVGGGTEAAAGDDEVDRLRREPGERGVHVVGAVADDDDRGDEAGAPL